MLQSYLNPFSLTKFHSAKRVILAMSVNAHCTGTRQENQRRVAQKETILICAIKSKRETGLMFDKIRSRGAEADCK